MTRALIATLTLLAVLAASVPVGAQSSLRIGASLSLTGEYGKIGKYQPSGYSSARRTSTPGEGSSFSW